MPTEQLEGQWYPDHVASWYKHKNDDNVKFVCYEDLARVYLYNIALKNCLVSWGFDSLPHHTKHIN